MTPLIQALQNPALYDHPVSGFRVVETHISWVILTGFFAYKIKKPVNLGFLDFVTLEKRRLYCEEEVRINRRLCPDLYIGVLPLTGEPRHPVLGGPGTAFEYLVKMKQFDEDLLWDRMLERGELRPEHMDALAHLAAEFHRTAPAAPPDSSFGLPETFWRSAAGTQRHIARFIHTVETRALFSRVVTWLEKEYRDRSPRMVERHRQGCVREGHGDMHLRNIALFSRARPDILLFDGIEFDPRLRWIDVMNDAAFLIMDLEHWRRPDYAWRFLNAYLEITGDYEGLDLLRLYAANRALVRAKVLAIQKSEEGVRRFLELAATYARAAAPALYITHGLSGSGKTTASKRLAEKMGAARIHSDIERKRLFGLAAGSSSSDELKQRMYGQEGNERTYARLKDLSLRLLKVQYTVIVDAAFLSREWRNGFRELAAQCRAPFRILDFRLDEQILRERVRKRMWDGKDASEADLRVLEDQIRGREDLGEEEKPFVIQVDTAESRERG